MDQQKDKKFIYIKIYFSSLIPIISDWKSKKKTDVVCCLSCRCGYDWLLLKSSIEGRCPTFFKVEVDRPGAERRVWVDLFPGPANQLIKIISIYELINLTWRWSSEFADFLVISREKTTQVPCRVVFHNVLWEWATYRRGTYVGEVFTLKYSCKH